MKYVHLYLLLISASLIGNPLQASEDLAVVIAADTQADISLEQISHVFLGRSVTATDGGTFKPLVYGQSNAMHRQFSRSVLKRSARQLKSFWVKQLFTGKGEVPKKVASVEEMKAMLGKSKNYIGYVPLSEVHEDLRIVHIIEGGGGA